MSLNSVNSSYKAGVSAYQSTKAAADEAAKTADEAEQKVEAQRPKEDTFEKSPNYKPDMEKVSAMKADLQNNISAFRQMVQGLMHQQGGVANTALDQLLKIDEATQLSAQQAIAEDGEWGVEAVAGRILDFAKAISGGDPSKIEMLRSAVNEGFAAAEKVWGGTLPEISYQTRDRVMQGFDEWAKSAAEPEVPAES